MSFTLSRTRISTVVVITAIISADTHELYYIIMYTQQRLPTRDDTRNAHRRIYEITCGVRERVLAARSRLIKQKSNTSIHYTIIHAYAAASVE